MSIDTRFAEDVLTVDLGTAKRAMDLTGKHTDALGKVIRQALDQGRTKILIDLQHVRFVDSAGLGALVMYKNHASDKGGDVKFLRPRGQLQKVFKTVKLDTVFDIHEDEAAAIASFK